ncbi:MAG: helicase-exonuclease AddAB subunit AddA [Clostridiales bacterium]|nr:helicase-exonuclease AddAB subunit AddA [Clostridiales bacterium]
MSKNKWTDSQLEAIHTKYRQNGESCNLLVSAAAGSGKTAVLVQRIIEKLIPEDMSKGGDIDRLLVVTFTNAAAREMENRIAAALSAALDEAVSAGDAERRNIIRRQQLLLTASDITTIDAFCLKLVREHFNLLDIDPDFSIADSAQASILADEAMEELFNDLYEEGNEDFINLLCLYGTGRSDEPLADIIRYIYGFIRSIPDPIGWLNEKTYELSCPDGIENTAWYKKGLNDCLKDIEYSLECTASALEYMCDAKNPAGFFSLNPPEKGVGIYDEWKSYYKLFHTVYSALSPLSGADIDVLRRGIIEFEMPRLAALSSKSDEEKDHLKILRDRISASISAAKRFFSLSPKEAQEQSITKLYPQVRSLAALTEMFDRRFMQKKISRNILEFSDIEQLTEELLRKNPDIAKELQGRYDEILMDEYQDTSPLQERIFSYITDGSNLFMVGDMKQSIYRFRSSDPSIFKHKSDLYINEKDAENRKIILSKNFRSRKEVLSGVNDLFSAIMTEEAGELDYDAEQMLYPGNEDFKQLNDSYTPECCIIELPEKDASGDDITKPELEAAFIAGEINRLKREHFQITDKNGSRDIENRDIVILMSSYKSSADIYTSVFNSAGIECFAESQSYFERSEIRLMLALLKTVLNPHNDIPLIGIMRSPIASFTDDELAVIRKFSAGSFYSAVCELVNCADNGQITDGEQCGIAKKAKSFLTDLSRWREYSRYMPSDKLVWTLYEETDFYAFAGAMYDGEEAQANLRLLFERAKEFENNGFQGLFSFIKYIERIKKSENDLSSANLVGEGHNVVRIMTIHKSKGLEFPVVFVAGGSKRFQKKADNPNIILHKDLGIAADSIDFEEGVRYETPAKAIFKSAIAAEQISEEIRKLYVALTRAKEKLYFVASIAGGNKSSGKPSGLDKFIPEKQNAITCGTIAPKEVLSSMCFADWVAPVALNSENWIFRSVEASDLSGPVSDETTQIPAAEHRINIEHILDFKYPYSGVSDLPTKVSVSELKASHETQLVPKPRFLCGKQENGAYYGTAMHTAMQNILPHSHMSEDYIRSEIARLTEEGKLTIAEADIINPGKILNFYHSEAGRRILSASNVIREQAFEVSVPASYLFPDRHIPADEKVILQGIIDCWFEEDGGIVLMDYKTDSFRDVDEIREKYAKQLELYSYAIEKITKKPVKEKFIYLFFDNSVLYL